MSKPRSTKRPVPERHATGPRTQSRTRFLNEIERCRAIFESTGERRAVQRALVACVGANVFPGWLLQAVWSTAGWHTDKEGSPEPLLVHLVRWAVVERAHERGFRWRRNPKGAPGAYDFAAEYLTATGAGGGGADAMAKSHSLIAGKLRKNPNLNEITAKPEDAIGLLPPRARGLLIVRQFLKIARRSRLKRRRSSS